MLTKSTILTLSFLLNIHGFGFFFFYYCSWATNVYLIFNFEQIIIYANYFTKKHRNQGHPCKPGTN